MQRTSFLVQKFPESTEEIYKYSIQVPPMSGVARHIRKKLGKQGISEVITFSEGCLKSVDHSFKVTIASDICDDKIDHISIKPILNSSSSPFWKVFVVSISVSCLRHGVVQNKSELSHNPLLLEDWNSSKGFKWTDDTTEILFEIKIKKETDQTLEFLTPQKFYEHKPNNTALDTGKYFLSPELSDIEIKCGEKKFSAHTFVLGCKSTIMGEHFGLSRQEFPDLIVINDVEPEIMKELLRFLYTGKVEGIDKITCPLYYAAHKYSVDDLKSLCEATLLGQINTSNALQMLEIAEACSGSILQAKAKSILAVASPPKRGAPTSNSVRGGKRSRIDGF